MIPDSARRDLVITAGAVAFLIWVWAMAVSVAP